MKRTSINRFIFLLVLVIATACMAEAAIVTFLNKSEQNARVWCKSKVTTERWVTVMTRSCEQLQTPKKLFTKASIHRNEYENALRKVQRDTICSVHSNDVHRIASRLNFFLFLFYTHVTSSNHHQTASEAKMVNWWKQAVARHGWLGIPRDRFRILAEQTGIRWRRTGHHTRADSRTKNSGFWKSIWLNQTGASLLTGNLSDGVTDKNSEWER